MRNALDYFVNSSPFNHGQCADLLGIPSRSLTRYRSLDHTPAGAVTELSALFATVSPDLICLRNHVDISEPVVRPYMLMLVEAPSFASTLYTLLSLDSDGDYTPVPMHPYSFPNLLFLSALDYVVRSGHLELPTTRTMLHCIDPDFSVGTSAQSLSLPQATLPL